MPYVNLKFVKEQVNKEQKKLLVDGVMDIIADLMGRNRDLTVITIDELDPENWIVGGKSLEETQNNHGKVSYVNIKISKGTSNPVEMTSVIEAGKKLVQNVLGSNDLTNFFIIEELNPDGWGFDGISMTVRNELEKQLEN
ncbi:tautomerase family protein [Flavobacterium sp. XS2P24]|uniref:tautomerase family protein n=1 Tax=Flavobacterium sp. XS2P24 TaxID=3041249 RepID=UPI0024A7D4E7|nr:tautomerase family protein [Flavobacterium sp. XS2P24]MDI6049869.1 tautomerase family protein [Flavobacterium sp. XS2P24]